MLLLLPRQHVRIDSELDQERDVLRVEDAKRVRARRLHEPELGQILARLELAHGGSERAGGILEIPVQAQHALVLGVANLVDAGHVSFAAKGGFVRSFSADHPRQTDRYPSTVSIERVRNEALVVHCV
jgi:hypothetical protein